MLMIFRELPAHALFITISHSPRALTEPARLMLINAPAACFAQKEGVEMEVPSFLAYNRKSDKPNATPQ